MAKLKFPGITFTSAEVLRSHAAWIETTFQMDWGSHKTLRGIAEQMRIAADLSGELLVAVEEMLTDTKEAACDTATLDHPYFGAIVRLVARARGEEPQKTLERLGLVGQ
jgi:hypothetical protein